MASRNFYMTSTALLGGSALLLWFAFGRAAAPGSPASTPTSEAHAAAGALGVVGADHDPADTAIRDESARNPRSFVQEPLAANALGDLPERGSRPAEVVAVAAEPPVAASPGLNAASEASAAAQPKLEAALRADLERRRDGLHKSCWPPGSDAAGTFTVEASYAADGALVALGVSDVPGLPGVGTCLMGQLSQKPPSLPEPPGVAVAVAVPIAFAGAEIPPAPSPRSTGASSPSER